MGLKEPVARRMTGLDKDGIVVGVALGTVDL